ncbi:hypothetical protein D3C78_1883980 [compost metagenome]
MLRTVRKYGTIGALKTMVITTATIKIPAGRNSRLDKGYASKAVTSKAVTVPINVVDRVRRKDLHRSDRPIK